MRDTARDLEPRPRSPEAVAAAFARRQRGNVTHRQLLAAGFSRHAIHRRVAAGVLRATFPGVYVIGCAPQLCAEAGALLCCGPGALLGRCSAAPLWGVPAPAPEGVELLVVGRTRHSPPGAQVRSIGHLAPGELRRVNGLPVASPSLTLLDLAALIARDELADALHDARHRGVVRDAQLHATLAAHPRRAGARALAAVLRSDELAFAVESRAEARCLRAMLAAGLRPDASQARIGPYRVDFLFARERLVVEVEGFRHHGRRSAFDGDRRRTAYLAASGLVVFPITWTDLDRDERAAMERLRRALAARRRP